MLFGGMESLALGYWATVVWIWVGLYVFITTKDIFIYGMIKVAQGFWATVVWMGAGLYLYINTEGASLFSWSALVFILVGMFAALIVFGNAGYAFLSFETLLEEKMPAVAARVKSFDFIRGWLAFAAETVVVFLAASWVFHQIV